MGHCRAGPVRVAGLTGVVQIAGGYLDGFVLRSGCAVWSWGWSFTPNQVSDRTGVQQVSAGANAGYARSSGGTAWAWGSDEDAELGDGHPFGHAATPIKVTGATGGEGLRRCQNRVRAVPIR